MKKLLLFILFFSIYAHIYSQKTISILTCSPGNDIHSTFGHTAIRYTNPHTDTDVIYNYGIFSYTEDFVYNFVRGNTYYKLGKTSTSRFLSNYYYDNRYVVEQKLNLHSQQIDSILSFLETNYVPENRTYLYNFLYDNCATRPRDVLETTLNDSLIWNPTHEVPDSLWLSNTATLLSESNSITWRDLLHEYLDANSWLRFGIGLTLGIPTDKPATEYESMFLPDCLFLKLASASLIHNDNHTPLVSSTAVLVSPHTKHADSYNIYNPYIILWVLAFLSIVISYIEYRTHIHFYLLDSILYFIVGLLGVLIWYISFVSIHPAVFPNLHTIWASPLNILFAVFWLFPHIRRIAKWYLIIYSTAVLLFCLAALLHLQDIHAGVIAVCIILLSRNTYFVTNGQH
ncbi:MAG: DUF4105 domain-containing protein [Bacteroidales bacterium]